MTKETERHVMTRTMELKRKNKLVCYPKLVESDFGGCGVNIASRIATDFKFDETKRENVQLEIITKSLELVKKDRI